MLTMGLLHLTSKDRKMNFKTATSPFIHTVFVSFCRSKLSYNREMAITPFRNQKIMNEQLQNIVSQINQNSIDIENTNLLAREHGRKGLELAIKTGELLCQCKEIRRKEKGTTGWETWFEQNVKGFTVRMGQYYIKLYKHQTKHVSFFDDCESIREALRKIDTVEAEKKLSDLQTECQLADRKERTKENQRNKPKEMSPNMVMKLYPKEYKEYKNAVLKRLLFDIQTRFREGFQLHPHDGFKKLKFNVCEWTIESECPKSPDEDNQSLFCGFIRESGGWVSKRDYEKVDG